VFQILGIVGTPRFEEWFRCREKKREKNLTVRWPSNVTHFGLLQIQKDMKNKKKSSAARAAC
jgi:hypothetical protein